MIKIEPKVGEIWRAQTDGHYYLIIADMGKEWKICALHNPNIKMLVPKYHIMPFYWQKA
jgi:hypothetical protein